MSLLRRCSVPSQLVKGTSVVVVDRYYLRVVILVLCLVQYGTMNVIFRSEQSFTLKEIIEISNAFEIGVDNGNCQTLNWTQPVQKQTVKPVWVASFPGSGAEMFRLFVESITAGAPGWSIYDSDHPGNQTCTQVNAATCKTHWPVLSKEPPTAVHNQGRYHSKAILLLRNPANAFPSRLNHQFEIINRRGFHTQQAPEKVWNRWIRQHAAGEVRAYYHFLRTWLNSSLPSVGLVVPYEGLTNPQTGLFWATKIVDILHDAHHIVPTDSKSLGCLWRKSIFNKPQRKRAEHTYQPGYRPADHQRLQRLIEELLRDVTNKEEDLELFNILQGYHVTLANHTQTRILTEGEG
jgi:hypothetical protein